jgi:hypothetical protein
VAVRTVVVATELGMQPEIAHCQLALGKLRLRSGEQRVGEEHLRTAIAMYRQMNMPFWLEKAAAEIGRLR